MLAYFNTTLGRGDLLKRTRETEADSLGLTAQLGHCFFLPLFPAHVFMLAPASMIPGFDVVGLAAAVLPAIAPAEVMPVLREQLTTAVEASHDGRMPCGIVPAPWNSSSARVALSERGLH